MGFPGHFRIPEHTGADFKHRKAFSRIKAYHKKHPKYFSATKNEVKENPLTPSDRKSYRNYKTDRIINLSIKLPIFLVAVFVAGMGLYDLVSHYGKVIDRSNDAYKIALAQHQESERQEAYDLFVRTGNRLLHANLLDQAQAEFTRALKQDIYGVSARIGLTKTLIQQCRQQHIRCEEAERNLEYLKKMKYLSKAEVEELRLK